MKLNCLALTAATSIALSVGSVVFAPAFAADTDTHTQDADTRLKDIDTKDLETRLADARARLEQAAHEVAELSSQMGGQWVDKFYTFNDEGMSRAVIGVQLDSEKDKDGAIIQEVSPGGPADDAGLRVGDVITSINGTDVKGAHAARQVMRVMHKVVPDSKVNVRVTRDGKPRDFVVTARRGPTFLGMREPFVMPVPPIPPVPGAPGINVRTFGPVMVHGALGEMELATLTPQLGHYFGTDKGVLVVRAPRDFKLEDGDVILAIDGRQPSSGSHATRILASYQPGEKVSIKIMRQQKALNIETTLPERHASIESGGDGSDGDRAPSDRDHKTKMIPHQAHEAAGGSST